MLRMQVGKRGVRTMPTPRMGSQNPFTRMMEEEPAQISRMRPVKTGKPATGSAGNGHGGCIPCAESVCPCRVLLQLLGFI